MCSGGFLGGYILHTHFPNVKKCVYQIKKLKSSGMWMWKKMFVYPILKNIFNDVLYLFTLYVDKCLFTENSYICPVIWFNDESIEVFFRYNVFKPCSPT